MQPGRVPRRAVRQGRVQAVPGGLRPGPTPRDCPADARTPDCARRPRAQPLLLSDYGGAARRRPTASAAIRPTTRRWSSGFATVRPVRIPPIAGYEITVSPAECSSTERRTGREPACSRHLQRRHDRRCDRTHPPAVAERRGRGLHAGRRQQDRTVRHANKHCPPPANLLIPFTAAVVQPE